MRRLLVMRGARLALLFSLAAAISGSPAAATSTLLWDMEGFPPYQQGLEVGDAVYPTDYGCNGMTYCTGFGVYSLALNGGESVSRTIDGVTGTFSRPNWQAPGLYSGSSLLTISGSLGAGNTIEGDAHGYLADFSVGFVSAGVDVAAPYDLGAPFGSYGAFLDMWSGPGGTGELLARAEAVPGEPYSGRLSVDAPAGSSARSLVFGRFLVGAPGCVYEPYGGGLSFPCLYGSPGAADNVAIVPVPEPGALVPVAVGLAVFGAGRGRRRARSAVRGGTAARRSALRNSEPA